MAQSNKSIGIGIIGCGTIAERMIRAWRPHMRDAHLAAVSDVSNDRTQHFQNEFGIRNVFSDHRELLTSTDVGAVLVLTPNFLHASQSIDAMKAGKHVLCQKPMAMNIAEAKSMVDTAAETGVTLMAAYVKRFWPYYGAAKKLIEDGRIGRLISIRTQFSHSGIGKYYVPASNWFNDREKAGGGPLSDLGVHHFDVMRWLVGAEVSAVGATMSNSNGNSNELEDNALVTLQFANGVLGQGFYSFTTVAPPGVTLERLELYGTTGTAIVSLAHPGRVVVQYCNDTIDSPSRGGWMDLPVTEPIPAFALMLQHFVDSLRAGTTPITTGVDGLRSVEIAAAAYVSAAEGRTVDIGEPRFLKAPTMSATS